jgi:hypothetical protein
VIERGQNLRFALETEQTVFILGEERREDLDRDVAIELAVARAVHLAHATAAKEIDDRIRAKLPPDEGRRLFRGSQQRNCRRAQKLIRRGLTGEERFDFAAQLAVARTGLGDE